MGMHVMGVRVDFGGCAAPDIARAFASDPDSDTRVVVPSVVSWRCRDCWTNPPSPTVER